MDVRADIWAGRPLPTLTPSYRKIVVRSSERTDPSASTNNYTNQIEPFHDVKAPSNRICLSDFYLPASQWTIEEDWSRLYVTEGFNFDVAQTVGLGPYELVVLPNHLPVTTITKGAAVPVSLGGGTAIQIQGDFVGNWGMAIFALQQALGKDLVLTLRGVSGYPDLEIPADTIIGNDSTGTPALYVSEAPGTPGAAWSLAAPASAGVMTLDIMVEPSQMANYITIFLSLYAEAYHALHGPPAPGEIYSPSMRWNAARGCFDLSWYGTPDLNQIHLVGSSNLLAQLGMVTGTTMIGTHSDERPGYDDIVFFTASSTKSPAYYTAVADIQPGNYASRASLVTAVQDALNSNQVPSGLTINVKQGNTSGTTIAVVVPAGRYSSGTDFASALAAAFTTAGLSCTVTASATGFDVTLTFASPHRVEWNGNEALFGRVNATTLGKVHEPELSSRQLAFGMLDSYAASLDSTGSRIAITKDDESSLLVPTSVSGSGNLMTFSFDQAHGLPAGTRFDLTWNQAGEKSAEAVAVAVPSTTSLQVLISGAVAYTGSGATIHSAALHKIGSAVWGLVTQSTPRIHQALKIYNYDKVVTTRSLGLAPGLNLSSESGTLLGANAMDLTSSGYVLVNLIVNGRPAAGRTSHLAYNATKRLVKPLARICLDRGWLNAVEHDHRHCINLDEKVVVKSIGVELLNADHTPYKTHGLENSFTLMLDTFELPVGLGTL